MALLEAGVASGVAYDLSPAYREVSALLLSEHGLADRVDWRTGDFVGDASAPRADVVFLNRVVCCYPDMEGMVDAASSSTGHLLAMSYPRNSWWVRVGVRMLNGFLWLGRTTFRVFVHSTDDIQHRAAAAGLTEVSSGRTVMWEWHVWERAIS